MSGTLAKLVRMINHIAGEFEHQKGVGAARATADHLRHFWEPRMRREIIDHLEAGGVGLGPTGLAAVTLLRDGVSTAPPPVT